MSVEGKRLLAICLFLSLLLASGLVAIKSFRKETRDLLPSKFARARDQGLWKATTDEHTIKPLEKEIVIELPIPKNQLQYMVLLEVLTNYGEIRGYSEVAKILGTILEKFNETRTIKIKGKNVDDLELEKIANLIQQANERSSKVNLKGLLKRLKKP